MKGEVKYMGNNECDMKSIQHLAKEISSLKEMIKTFAELIEIKQLQILDLMEGVDATGLYPKISRPETSIGLN